MSAAKVKKELKLLANPEKAKLFLRFFKTGKGEYGEGDVFLGLTVPQQRGVVKKYRDLALEEAEKLLQSKIHEHRLVALLILVEKYQKGEERLKKEIFDLYLRNTKGINNWDLVDLSAPKIVGPWLLDKDRSLLYKLVRSKNLWERRIGVMATFAFIRENQFEDNLKIAEMLLDDKHDLIHKAVGWMLREIGKRDQGKEEAFLQKHGKRMPRTMLRYAIEKFPEKKRQFFLKKTD